MKHLIRIISSFFYLGYVPFAPGTAGSLGALCLYFLVRESFVAHTIALVIVIIVGFLISAPAERLFGEKDSPRIVIDEVAGMLLALWALKLDLVLVIVGFFIFRVLDATKVYPSNKLEKLPGSWGVMSDDLCAGLYTNLVLQLVSRVLVNIWWVS